MTCDRCGAPLGTEGVTTVELSRKPDGGIDHIPVRECRPCAIKEARAHVR